MIRISIFLGNTLYAVALIYYTYITFLGYNCTVGFKNLTYCSTSISTGNSTAVNPYPRHNRAIYYQSLWIPCFEAGC
jgi:UNC-50 family